MGCLLLSDWLCNYLGMWVASSLERPTRSSLLRPIVVYKEFSIPMLLDGLIIVWGRGGGWGWMGPPQAHSGTRDSLFSIFILHPVISGCLWFRGIRNETFLKRSRISTPQSSVGDAKKKKKQKSPSLAPVNYWVAALLVIHLSTNSLTNSKTRLNGI